MPCLLYTSSQHCSEFVRSWLACQKSFQCGFQSKVGIQRLGMVCDTFLHITEYKDDAKRCSGLLLAWTVLVNRQLRHLAMHENYTECVVIP